MYTVDQLKAVPEDAYLDVKRPMVWTGNCAYYTNIEYVGKVWGQVNKEAIRVTSVSGDRTFVMIVDEFGFTNDKKDKLGRVVNADAIPVALKDYIVVQKIETGDSERWMVMNNGKPMPYESAFDIISRDNNTFLKDVSLFRKK